LPARPIFSAFAAKQISNRNVSSPAGTRYRQSAGMFLAHPPAFIPAEL